MNISRRVRLTPPLFSNMDAFHTGKHVPTIVS